MLKNCIFISFLIILYCDSNLSVIIECSYSTGGFLTTNAIYYCAVKKDPNISTQESAQNCTISGDHQSSKTNDHVLGLYAAHKTINIFPQGLEKSFKNLQRLYIDGCKLEEIHQYDLKPFTQLSHIYIVDIIEVIEEGLFDYNPKLEWIGLSGTKIIHIDPNVFDHLNKLATFWFSNVTCVHKHVSDSYERVQEAIKLVKSQCGNSDFKELEEKIINLESESKVLKSEEFKEKLEKVEKIFIISKFSKFRPLNYKFENLKKSQNSNLSATNVNQKYEQLETSSECSKTDQSSAQLMSNLKNISGLLIDIKSSQCGIKDPLSDMSNSIAALTSKINDVTSSQDQLKISQSNAASSIDSLKSSQESCKSTLNDIKESISDIEATLSNVKTSQNDFKSSLSKIKTSQNEIRISLDELKGSKSENTGDDMANIKEKLGKLEGLEGHLLDFEIKNAEKFDKLEREFVNNRHKMEINFDGKIKEIEKRIMKKFEEILEEKLGKILEEKLESILSSLKH